MFIYFRGHNCIYFFIYIYSFDFHLNDGDYGANDQINNYL